MPSLDVEQRHRICRLVEGIIAADGVITAEERAFLQKVATRFDVDFEVMAEGPVSARAPVSDPGRAATLLRQLDPDVKKSVMGLLIESAISDGVVDPEEHALLMVAAAALGIDAAHVEERITSRLPAERAIRISNRPPR